MVSNDDVKQNREISRQQIYDLVWQQPMIHVAKGLGLSDQGLAKLCKREQIPRPPQGHWNKLAAGKPVGPKPPLPAGAKGADVIVHRRAGSSEPPATPKSQIDQFRAELPDIRVPERLTNPHPLVEERIAFRDEEVREGQTYYDHRSEKWQKVVPFDSADRRLLRVLDAVCKSLEARGAIVEKNQHGELTARSGQDVIAFQLRYRLKQVKVPITPDDWRWSFKGKNATRLLLEPTGDLIFEIKNWMPAGFRRNWREGPKHRLEQMISDIVATMLVAFPALAARREEREEEERRYRTREEQRREREERQRIDRNRFRRLTEHAEAWREASLVRDFAAALRNTDLDREAVIDEMTVGQWLDWVDAAIERHDPLSHPSAVFASIAAVHRWTYSD
ncbi:MAG: hypothetical protein J7499_03295 [Sphingopyxis sp.]|nr:hypothetical protein [Sphingopyxis sp.]